MNPCDRITVNPPRMVGVPCIRGLHIPVAAVAVLVAEGMGGAEVLTNDPDLHVRAIGQAPAHASEDVRESRRALAAA